MAASRPPRTSPRRRLGRVGRLGGAGVLACAAHARPPVAHEWAALDKEHAAGGPLIKKKPLRKREVYSAFRVWLRSPVWCIHGNLTEDHLNPRISLSFPLCEVHDRQMGSKCPGRSRKRARKAPRTDMKQRVTVRPLLSCTYKHFSHMCPPGDCRFCCLSRACTTRTHHAARAPAQHGTHKDPTQSTYGNQSRFAPPGPSLVCLSQLTELLMSTHHPRQASPQP
jgi:hypothetical protein